MTPHMVRATLLSPLVVKRERQSQRSEGVQSISGTLLRGAFAQAYLQQRGDADAMFRRLFLDEQACRFGPLDPGDRVYPLTATSCKREPGLVEDHKHGVVDQLLSRVRLRLTGSSKVARCRVCQNDLKPHIGFWNDRGGHSTEPKLHWRRGAATHVGIDRHTHTASEQILYSLPSLEAAASEENSTPSLIGNVEADVQCLHSLQALLRQENQVVYIGGARTRGYGRVRIELLEGGPAQSSDPDEWSFQLLKQVGVPDLTPDRHFIFSLTFTTGAILLDELLRYTVDPAGMEPWLPALPSADPLERTLTRTGKDFRGGKLWCVTAVTSQERLRGWNAAHGLPRQDEWAITHGAVYVYLLEGDSSCVAALKDQLRRLEIDGIGARRNEGFGRVLVSDAFHQRFCSEKGSL